MFCGANNESCGGNSVILHRHPDPLLLTDLATERYKDLVFFVSKRKLFAVPGDPVNDHTFPCETNASTSGRPT